MIKSRGLLLILANRIIRRKCKIFATNISHQLVWNVFQDKQQVKCLSTWDINQHWFYMDYFRTSQQEESTQYHSLGKLKQLNLSYWTHILLWNQKKTIRNWYRKHNQCIRMSWRQKFRQGTDSTKSQKQLSSIKRIKQQGKLYWYHHWLN